MKYVAYIKINGKITCELWSMDFSKSLEVRLGTLLNKIEIKEEDINLTFDQLRKKYPYEEEIIIPTTGLIVPVNSDSSRS